MDDRPTPYIQYPSKQNRDRIRRAIEQPRIKVIDVIFVNDFYRRFKVHGANALIYTVSISRKPRCTCLDKKYTRMLCKHILYVFIFVLSFSVDDEYLWQRSFSYAEVEYILS